MPADRSPLIARLRPLLFALVLALGIFHPRAAHALSCSATISNVDFGQPQLLTGEASDALATLTVTCTSIPALSTVKMCPSIGAGSGGSNGAARLMAGPGGATLSYQLFQDSSRTVGWGSSDDTALGSVPVISLSGGLTGTATVTRTIYARLFGSQSTAPPGNYSSAFTGTAAAFSYGIYYLAASGSCSGYVGTAIVRPQFSVLASPAATCTLATNSLAFPSAGVLSTALRAQADIAVTCTRPTAYVVSLDNGQAGTAPTARKMTSASGATVTYALYSDSARNHAWGNTATQTVSGTGTGTTQALTIYGLVPAQASPQPGNYSDRVVVTLTY